MEERYSLEEQETIISWDKAGDIAIIYTFEPRWQKHIEDVLGIKPSKKTKRGYARDYEIPKKWLPLPRKPRQASPKQREVLSVARQAAQGHRNPRKGSTTPVGAEKSTENAYRE